MDSAALQQIAVDRPVRITEEVLGGMPELVSEWGAAVLAWLLKLSIALAHPLVVASGRMSGQEFHTRLQRLL